MSIENIREYVESFGIFGEPVEYNGFNIYPILMKDSVGFDNKIGLFQIEKNKMGSVEIIQMSYLMFLLSSMIVEDGLIEDFLWLMEKTLHIHFDDKLVESQFKPNVMLERKDDNKEIFTINGWDISFEISENKASVIIGGKIMNSTDFDEFRRIVCYQNIYDYDDRPMTDDVKRVVEQYYKLKNKGVVMPTLEKKMLVVLSNSSETRESLASMPYKQFESLFHVIIDKIEYMVSVPLIPHLKEPKTEHWVYQKEKDRFDGVFRGADDIGTKTIR